MGRLMDQAARAGQPRAALVGADLVPRAVPAGCITCLTLPRSVAAAASARPSRRAPLALIMERKDGCTGVATMRSSHTMRSKHSAAGKRGSGTSRGRYVCTAVPPLLSQQVQLLPYHTSSLRAHTPLCGDAGKLRGAIGKAPHQH